MHFIYNAIRSKNNFTIWRLLYTVVIVRHIVQYMYSLFNDSMPVTHVIQKLFKEVKIGYFILMTPMKSIQENFLQTLKG